MKNDFLNKRFNPDSIYNWESKKFLEKSIGLVEDTEKTDLIQTYGKAPNKFLDRLNQLVDK